MTNKTIKEGLFIARRDYWKEDCLMWTKDDDKSWVLENTEDFDEGARPFQQAPFTKKSFYLPLEFWNNNPTEYVEP